MLRIPDGLVVVDDLLGEVAVEPEEVAQLGRSVDLGLDNQQHLQ